MFLIEEFNYPDEVHTLVTAHHLDEIDEIHQTNQIYQVNFLLIQFVSSI